MKESYGEISPFCNTCTSNDGLVKLNIFICFSLQAWLVSVGCLGCSLRVIIMGLKPKELLNVGLVVPVVTCLINYLSITTNYIRCDTFAPTAGNNHIVIRTVISMNRRNIKIGNGILADFARMSTYHPKNNRGIWNRHIQVNLHLTVIFVEFQLSPFTVMSYISVSRIPEERKEQVSSVTNAMKSFWIAPSIFAICTKNIKPH